MGGHGSEGDAFAVGYHGRAMKIWDGSLSEKYFINDYFGHDNIIIFYQM